MTRIGALAVLILVLPATVRSLDPAADAKVHSLAVADDKVPTEVRKAMSGLSGSGPVKRASIPAAELKALDEFAAKSAGVKECKLRAVYGCGSCCNGSNDGSLAITDCGPQCWGCQGSAWCGSMTQALPKASSGTSSARAVVVSGGAKPIPSVELPEPAETIPEKVLKAEAVKGGEVGANAGVWCTAWGWLNNGQHFVVTGNYNNANCLEAYKKAKKCYGNNISNDAVHCSYGGGAYMCQAPLLLCQ